MSPDLCGHGSLPLTFVVLNPGSSPLSRISNGPVHSLVKYPRSTAECPSFDACSGIHAFAAGSMAEEISKQATNAKQEHFQIT